MAGGAHPEHHARIIAGIGERRIPGAQFAAVWRFKPGEQAQQRALAAAAAPHHRHKLPGGNMQIQRVKDGFRAVAFGHAFQQQRRSLVESCCCHAFASFN